MNPRGLRILDALDGVAGKHKASPAQVALAWLAQRPAVVAPIASASKAEQVADLVAAGALTLDAGDIRQLDAASASS